MKPLKSAEERTGKYSELRARAWKTLEGNTLFLSSGPLAGKRIIVPSLTTYRGAWNWDSAFLSLTVSRRDAELALEQCDLFFERMEEDGMLPDAVLTDGTIYENSSKPPVFAWIMPKVLERANAGEERYAKYFALLEKNLSFWESERMCGGLFHYDARKGEFHERDSKNESGWDTSVRWDRGAWKLWAVDLNCYMILFYGALAVLAKRAGNGRKGEFYEKKAAELKKTVEERLWCEEKGYYCDYDYVDGCLSHVLSPAAFMPLFVGCSSPERAGAMAKLATDRRAFYPLIPTVAYSDPAFCSHDYWRGPAWLNVDYFAIEGLKRYGFADAAFRLKENILNACDAEKASIFEYYDSVTGKGLGAEGFGWSAAMIIELTE